MNKAPRAVLFLCYVGILWGTSGCSSTDVNRKDEEHSRIAEGCLDLLRSQSTNELTIAIEDPRVSPAIRALKPQQILLTGGSAGHCTFVIITREGRPSVYEFLLSSGYPHAGRLLAGGHGCRRMEVVWKSP